MQNSNVKYKLAVIIPNYNGEDKIWRMLDSILLQDFNDWRAFIIDDKSTDHSKEIINKYVVKDNRIIYFERNKEPKGAQTCRNIGFELSINAEFVMFIDNDDILASYCFKQRVEFMENHPKLDFSIFPAKAFSKDIKDEINYIYGCKYLEDSLNAMINWTLPMVGWTNIYRRSSYVKKRLEWDINLLSMQDSDFNIQAILKGCTYEYAESISEVYPDYFYYIPVGRNSISTKIKSKKHFTSHLYLMDKIINSFDATLKEKYKVDLLSYILQIIVIVGKNKPSVRQALSNSWVKEQHLFWLKLYLWYITGRKYIILYKFFETYFSYHNRKQRLWKSFMKEKADMFRQIL